jgi:hypothetical protein
MRAESSKSTRPGLRAPTRRDAQVFAVLPPSGPETDAKLSRCGTAGSPS